MNHPAADGSDPLIGAILQQRYRVMRRLGEGGMGAVYEAEHLRIKRRVAIKVLHPQFASKPEVVSRFHREAEAATSIGHPNIIEVTDMGELPNGSSFMVLEFLDGRDFAHDITEQGPQPVGKVVHILMQVCDALEAAHAKGIVHRDLKPENIFLIERGANPCFAKVLDFGISKMTEGEDRSLTRTGTALGTPYYMAPEQCQGKRDVDHRADIYALGVILFQALTGQYPFDDESYPMLVLKVCTEPPPPLTDYRSDLHPALGQTVARMLAKVPSNRFQNMSEVRAAIAPFVGEMGAPVVEASAPSTAARAPAVLERMSTPDAVVGSSSPVSLPSANTSRGPSPFLIGALFVGFMMVVLTGLGVGAWFALNGDANTTTDDRQVEVRTADPVPPAVPPALPPAQPTPPPAAVEPPPPEPSAATPEAIPVSISATPAEAQIEIDGELRPNPFEGELIPGMHHIRVTAPGYREVDRHERIERPTPIAIPLERVRTRPTRRQPTVRPSTSFGGSSPTPLGGAGRSGRGPVRTWGAQP